MPNSEKQETDPSFVFWGTPQISVEVLNTLKDEGLAPSLIITAPDRPQGRGMKLSPPPVKTWAMENQVEFLQPEKLDAEFGRRLLIAGCKLFAVVAYGKILPKNILEIPEHGPINLHYSLLPELRGASPVETAILENKNPTGVTTILMNEKMDEGPILLQEEVFFETWPIPKDEIFKKLNEVGGKLLAQTIKLLPTREIVPEEQDHSQATYTKKIKKKDGLIDLNDDPELNYRKYLAFQPWPGVFFFSDKNGSASGGENGKRVKITEAQLRNGKFVIKKVVPEGGKEKDWEN